MTLLNPALTREAYLAAFSGRPHSSRISGDAYNSAAITASVGDAIPASFLLQATEVIFPVSLSVETVSLLKVYFRTRDGTARARDGDYVSATGSVTFLPGQKVQGIPIQTPIKARSVSQIFFLDVFWSYGSVNLLGQASGICTLEPFVLGNTLVLTADSSLLTADSSLLTADSQ